MRTLKRFLQRGAALEDQKKTENTNILQRDHKIYKIFSSPILHKIKSNSRQTYVRKVDIY